MFFESFLINLLIILVLIIALIFDYVTKFFSYWYIRHVPYKTPIPIFGSDYHRVLGLRNNTDEVNKLYKQHPKEKFVGYIKSRIPDLVVKDPEVIKKMLSDFANFHSRGLALDRSQDVCIRNNLFYCEGEKWTVLREGLESLLKTLSSDIEDNVRLCLHGTNGDRNVQQLLSTVLDVIFKELLLNNDFDVSLITNLRADIERRSIMDKIKSYLKNIFPSIYVTLGLNTLSSQAASRSLEQSKLMKEIKGIGSILQLDIKEKNKRKFKSETEIEFAYSILAMFISEGYVPCMQTLTALFHDLSKYPEIQTKIRNEISNETGEYLDAVIKESLRLHPPISVITRKCVKAYQFKESGMLIDKGVTVNIPVQALHRDVQFFDNPEMFNPDRFMRGESHAAYFPFGYGARRCIGEELALNIIRSITKAVIQKYRIDPSEDTPEKLSFTDYNFGRIINSEIKLTFNLLP